MEKRDLCERLFRFSVDVILYLRTVKNSVETMDIKRQLIKCSTSSAANYEEAQAAVSKPDFKNKIGISLKELRETNYFLRVFYSLKIGNADSGKNLVEESEELKKIMGAIMSKL
jgi:four helix bundle protein